MAQGERLLTATPGGSVSQPGGGAESRHARSRTRSSYLYRSPILCNKPAAGGPPWRGNVLLSAHPFRRVALRGHTARVFAAPELRCLLPPPPSWTSPVNQGRGQFDALEAEEEAEEGEGEGEEVTGLRAGLLVGEGERSIFTSLSRCVCAQRGRRALRV